jgi:ABC-type nitrate/sulfonate/bicarbonate transport system substrate-binding protein
MKMYKAAAAILGSMFLLAGGAGAKAENAPIVISYQPGLFWSLPFFIATEKNWWNEVDLEPSFVPFPAGAPQIAAAASKSWDVGGTGAIPAVLGAANYGIDTIAIGADESLVDQLMVRASKLELYKAKPELLRGQQILLTSNSTGDYVVTSCLAKYGLAKKDVQIVNMGQAQIVSAMGSNNADLAGVWEPNNFLLEENAAATKLCSGKDSGAVVLAVLVTRHGYGVDHPNRVARFLAVYLRAIKWMRENRLETESLLRRFLAKGGLTLGDPSIKGLMDGNLTFDLNQQLKAFSGTEQQKAPIIAWMTDMSAFMKNAGSLRVVPAATDYITDRYLQLVDRNDKLRSFVTGKTP